jgi:hypothetical protein
VTTPTRSVSPAVALTAYLLLLVAVAAAGWFRLWWPLLAGLVAFLALAVIAHRRTQ